MAEPARCLVVVLGSATVHDRLGVTTTLLNAPLRPLRDCRSDDLFGYVVGIRLINGGNRVINQSAVEEHLDRPARVEWPISPQVREQFCLVLRPVLSRQFLNAVARRKSWFLTEADNRRGESALGLTQAFSQIAAPGFGLLMGRLTRRPLRQRENYALTKTMSRPRLWHT